MNLSRQMLLGFAVFLGGSLMLFAMVRQINTNTPTSASAVTTQQAHEILLIEEDTQDTSSTDNPLTADIDTEKRLLEEKQKNRAARVAEQEKRTQAFLAEQQKAQALALQKAELESELYRQKQAKATNVASTNESADVQKTTDTDNGGSTVASDSENTTKTSDEIVKPVVKARPVDPEVVAKLQAQVAKQKELEKKVALQKVAQKTQLKQQQVKQQQEEAKQAPSSQVSYTVKRGDGLIKLSRQYNVPVEVLARANNMQVHTGLRVGQKLVIPSSKQATKIQRELDSNANSKNSNQADSIEDKVKDNNTSTPKTSAPKDTKNYTVKRGDGLIKLARQYNMPVEALAQANNLSTTSDLRAGQSLVIPSQSQIKQLEREAKKAAKVEATKRQAQQKLLEARQQAKETGARGQFGVQVALADNQAKANEMAKKLRAVGYNVTTSETSRGVRVIVGPEQGKVAALALKDKINADPRTGVSNAWVLHWR